MAQLAKRSLLDVVEGAIREGGGDLLCLSDPAHHPARYAVFRGDERHRTRIHIWNLTPGGRNRPPDEWRIQATGVGEFQQEPDGEALILGWEDDRGVFVGFDSRRHQGPLGHSPSIQVRQPALDEAQARGLGIHSKGSGELALAFRPGFLATYIAHARALHACGATASETELLQDICRRPAAVGEPHINAAVAKPRRFAVVAAKRALRDTGFRGRVLTAYRHSCAMCGLQLRLLDAAHILPAAHPQSTDGTDNGLPLCALHHRAFDHALVTFDAKFRIHVSEARTAQLATERKHGGLAAFRRGLRPALALPPQPRDRPAAHFVDVANRLRGWRGDTG